MIPSFWFVMYVHNIYLNVGYNFPIWIWFYVLQQKLAQKDGEIDRQSDIERLWKFYVAYKRRHRVDDIQKEQQRLLESGNFSATNMGE